jgi:glycosyltransferase involved in cell wall biosynthesis
MKKILILSYFFSPCTQTATNRVFAIVSHLKELGYDPIVVTRNWDLPISTPKDTLLKTGSKINYFKNEKYEAYYLPYKSSFRDRIFIKSDKRPQYKYFSKVLTFFISILELISNKFIPYSNLYTFSKYLIKNDENIKCVLISANPYMLFKFGYLLNKTTNIPWIADYRDAWTTNTMAKNERFLYKFLYLFHKRFEKKWVSTATFFTTISEEYVQNIGQLILKPGIYFYNGLNEFRENKETKLRQSNVIKLLYIGTIYSNQDVESLLKIVFDLNSRLSKKVELSFVGVGYNELQKNRILNNMYFNEYVKVYPWIDKSELKNMIESSDLLLLLSYKGYNGIPTSKLFEYLSYTKPILLYPTDNGLLEKILTEVGNHHILKSDIELLEVLSLYSENYYDQFKKFSIDSNKLEDYLTINQVKRLVDKINLTI